MAQGMGASRAYELYDVENNKTFTSLMSGSLFSFRFLDYIFFFFC